MAEGTIPELIDIAAAGHGRAEALAGGAERWSFARLRHEVRDAGRSAIALGIEPGDRVATWAPNSREWITTALGLVSVGAVLVPLNTRYKGIEAADIIRRSGAVALFTIRGFLGLDYPAMLAGEPLPALRRTVLLAGEADVRALGFADYREMSGAVSDRDLSERAGAVRPADLCGIIYTSGTTGRPKGVMSTHGQTLRSIDAWATVLTLRGGDRYLLANFKAPREVHIVAPQRQWKSTQE